MQQNSEQQEQEIKDKRREINRRYYEAHRAEILAHKKEYDREHADEISIKRRARYAANAEQAKEKNRQYRNTHKEEIKAQRKEYVQAHAEEISASHRKYYIEHRDYILAQRKKYRLVNAEKIKEYRLAYNEVRRWKARGNEKLKALRGKLSIKEISQMAGINKATLEMAEDGMLIPTPAVQLKLAIYYNVEIEELGFDDMPEVVKKKAKIEEQHERVSVRVTKGNMPIDSDVIGDRFANILERIKGGMKPAEARLRYGLEMDTYMVCWKILYGGLSCGKGARDAEILAGNE